MWWHTLIFHFHFYSTCCLGVQHTNKDLRMKKKKTHTITIFIMITTATVVPPSLISVKVVILVVLTVL